MTLLVSQKWNLFYTRICILWTLV